MRSTVLVLFAAITLAACSGSRPSTPSATPAAETAASGFVQQVYPFTVLDAEGNPIEHPFLGGFNVPRPQFIDIDSDGDVDLFMQEDADRIMFFEQVGTPSAPRFVYRSGKYENLDVGQWYRFADMDGDGDYDLLAERPFSHIRYYRNDGTATTPRFELAADSLYSTEGKAIFSDRQNIPNVTDIDCDGKLDLFIGSLLGTISRYEATGFDQNGVPQFDLLTERFEDIEIITQQMGIKHGANSLTFNDIDGDGDQDLFWGDFFEPGLLYIPNTGTCERPNLRNEPIPFPEASPMETSGYNAPGFADLDGDGDMDLFVGVLGGAFGAVRTGSDNFYFFEQTSPGAFALRTRRYLSIIDVGEDSVPAFADLDGDGDLDMLLSNKIEPTDLETGRVYLFTNTGSATAPVFAKQGALPLEPAFHYTPVLGDLDGDGDPDLLTGTWNDGIALYRNDGTAAAAQFTLVEKTFVQISRGSNTAPALGDLDGDGDLDLFIGEASGTLNYFRNDGTPQTPQFVEVTEAYKDIDVGRRSFPALADLDGDGDLDMVVGNEAGELFGYRNVGSKTAFDFEADPTLALPAGPRVATPKLADLDGDGDPDLISGSIGGGLVYFENQ